MPDMEHEAPDRAILLMGPTASGKSALALALHERLPVEIVSVDSSQVYRGLDIGTAKPTRAEQARAPHRLIDIRDPAETYSAAEFRADALREMHDITAAGRIPLLVGGTMFYFRALEFGLSDLPSADAAVRRRLADEARALGWPAMHERLRALDPEAGRRINPNDAQRIQRALEIHALTGRAPSELGRAAPPAPPPFHFIKVALMPDDRAALHDLISRRFQDMLDRGLVAEVERLYRRGDLNPEMPSIRTVGYRHVWEYLTKRINYNQMIARATAATRQLAKRQMTWLRRYPGVQFFNAPGAGKGPETECLEHLRKTVRPVGKSGVIIKSAGAGRPANNNSHNGPG
ncbi:MAG: tRNA (adenosine(37)-N6)-dimethylallyltransferase MiaA [Candidatus Muproteobacteria bacterium RIFCSPHIGHO2_01_FULL_65_16]|uniref:tRNA dimethylallyltransferase n=2 Tax=Candidatus Muproteobacteria TaxID=1817795 RepID=A0A1F6TJV2_9PROT|nr:MAG: tRNA (adenosine(37)-N6)-dimethylallyltransferase MiaA [Candidatus Muproteobacteria bacterium RIFCSPHIGHO2_01_FULL_65_16]